MFAIKARAKLASEAEVKSYLFDLLARRDYSRAQLRQKLNSRCDDSGIVERLLDQFAEQGYQSDLRFAEGFVRSRQQQGYGKRRVQFELQQKGVSAELIEELVDQDSREEALAYVRRKYAQSPAKDEKEKAKRYRHLAGRGFIYDDINYAFANQIEDTL